eukprot:TRINITY_DN7122_c0_g1_i2.p2 TRINITY_DN7122_c0_g1~~TRINITY_DN7122_c0_g1_i2.p2  ORF type:complete len:145 (+),score=2.04 TRINITY_DN7122_c0_g1_i2:315-749(+)
MYITTIGGEQGKEGGGHCWGRRLSFSNTHWNQIDIAIIFLVQSNFGLVYVFVNSALLAPLEKYVYACYDRLDQGQGQGQGYVGISSHLDPPLLLTILSTRLLRLTVAAFFVSQYIYTFIHLGIFVFIPQCKFLYNGTNTPIFLL